MEHDLDYYLPYKSLLKDPDDKVNYEEETFLYSSLYCLTNNNFCMKQFLKLNTIDESDTFYKPFYQIFYSMIKEIYKDITKNKESKSIKFIKEFINSIKKEEIKRYDPRILIVYILIATLQPLKKEQNDSIKIDQLLSSSFSHSFQHDIQYLIENDFVNLNLFLVSNSYKSIDDSYIWILNNYITNDKDNRNIIIKIKDIYGTESYEYLSYIQFNLIENEKYTMEKCFKNYLNEIIKKGEKSFYIEFPESIFIILFFGNKEENPHKCLYNFSEILDFTDTEYVGKDLKYNKYFLSNLIVCKFPKQEKVIFYTFCRKNKKDKFNIYDCRVKEVREGFDVQKYLKKDKEVDFNSTVSYPYVLVYTAIKDDER